MTKAVFLPLGLVLLLAGSSPLPAQPSPTDVAVSEAVLRQAKTIDLRQKLVAANQATTRGDLANGAKLYQEAAQLARQIGSGIDLETAQALAGLAKTRLALARQAQAAHDLIEAGKQISAVLNYDPKNLEAQALKRQNDQMIALSRGRVPDAATVEQIPLVRNEKLEAATMVQDGKLLYEMGKLEEAQAKLAQASNLDPDNVGAYYYLNLIQQAQLARDSFNHTADTQTRIQQVEKQWVLPKSQYLGAANPYATNNLVYTGPGRQAIVSKLDRIHLDSVSYDGLPLSEVLRDLAIQAKARDPEKIGLNFLINPNADQSDSVDSLANTPGGRAGAFPGIGGRAGALDPATGLPQADTAAAAPETVDVGSIIVKLSLTNVRMCDLLDAIVLVADGHIKYSIQDFAVVFSAKSHDNEPLYTRTFKVDANTFFQGLESVSSTSFGGTSGTQGGSGGGGGGGGGSGQTQGGTVIPVVDFAPGAGQIRSSQQSNGGGGGGAQTQQQGGFGGGNTGGGGGGIGGAAVGPEPWNTSGNQGGVNFLTVKRTTDEMSYVVRKFFTTMGVNLAPPKALFFNDRLGVLFVKASQSDLDTIEQAIEVLNQVPPQVHIKARFIEVDQSDTKALGFDWTLGQFGGSVVGQGGTSSSLTVPVSAANPLGAFPGSTAASIVPGAATDQSITSGLGNSAPTVATFTGILTHPNFQVAIHALENRTGTENLGEPEVTTTSGRQTQMRATTLVTVITAENFQSGGTGGTGTTAGGGAGVP